jgi:hypothetical protein
MRFVLNVIWLVLAGIWLALGYLVAAVVLLAITIIGSPLGIATFRIGGAALVPFGRQIVSTDGPWPVPRGSRPDPAAGVSVAGGGPGARAGRYLGARREAARSA